MRAKRRPGERSRWLAIACCALMLLALIGPVTFGRLVPHAQAAVLLSPTDPMLATPRGTPEKVMRFAQEKQSTRIAEVRAYIYEVYRLAPLVGLDPALVIAQSALETANWTSMYWTDYLNPAGIGIGYTGAPSYTWETGEDAARSQVVRLYIYSAGAIDPGNPLYQYRDVGPTWQRVVDLGYNGQVHVLDDLTGKWATDPLYGQKVASRGNGIYAVDPGDPTEPAVNPVSASSSAGGNPGRTRDGDLATTFAVTGIDSPPPGLFIDYDFGEPVAFQSIQWLFRSSNYADSYQLQTSDNGLDWTTRGSYVNPTAYAWNIYGGSVTARYVRMLITNPNGDMRLGYLSEIEFYGHYANSAPTATSTPYPIPTATNTPTPTNTPTVTNTPAATATPTSTATIAPTATPAMLTGQLLPIVGSGGSGSGNWSGYIRDGNLRTTWQTSSATPVSQAQVYVDLGQSGTVTGVEFMFRRISGARWYSIRVSEDKKSWTTVATFTYADPLVWQRAGFSASGRYVQFLFRNTNGTASLGYLAEVKVYGSAASFKSANVLPMASTPTVAPVATATATEAPKFTPTATEIIEPTATATSVSEAAATPIVIEGSLPIVELRRTSNSTEASALIDQDPATTWQSTGEAESMIYVVADLGQLQEVGSVRWLPGPNGLAGRLHIEISADGVNWESMAEPPSGLPGAWQEITVDRTASAVRIVVTNPDHAQSIGGIAELRIQPSAGP